MTRSTVRAWLRPVCIVCISALGLFPTAGRAEGSSVVSLLPPGEVAELARSHAQGGSGIESIEAVSTTLGAATQASEPSATPGAGFPATEPVVLIVMHGYFILGDVSVPPCAPTPTGTVLGLVAEQGSGVVTETSLTDGSPDLETLGTVEIIPVPEGIPHQVTPVTEQPTCTVQRHIEPVGPSGPVNPPPSSNGKQEAPNSTLDITVASGKGRHSRLRRVRVTVSVRDGATTASYSGRKLSLHLAPARYQLWAEVRSQSNGQKLQCPRRSVALTSATVTHITLHCASA
jgi:hypothetical protein